MTPPVLAGTRDASWWPNPSTSGPKRWHVWRDGFAACGTRAMLLDPRPAHEVPEQSRCRRCRWPVAPIPLDTSPSV